MSNIRMWRQRADGTDGGENYSGWIGIVFLILLFYVHHQMIVYHVLDVIPSSLFRI